MAASDRNYREHYVINFVSDTKLKQSGTADKQLRHIVEGTMEKYNQLGLNHVVGDKRGLASLLVGLLVGHARYTRAELIELATQIREHADGMAGE